MSDHYWLSKGAHGSSDEGRCAMEWTAYLAGEPHSDTPVCVSPVLRRFCISFNDNLSDSERQKLRPYLGRTIGTAGDGRDPERVRMCIEFLSETAFPTLLGHDEIALEQLRALPWQLAVENSARMVALGSEVRLIALQSRDRSYDRLSKAAGAAWAAWVAGVAGAAEVAGAAGAAFRKRVYDAAYKRCMDLNAELNPKAWELLERMLPTEVIQLPVAYDAELVCAAPQLEAVTP